MIISKKIKEKLLKLLKKPDFRLLSSDIRETVCQLSPPNIRAKVSYYPIVNWLLWLVLLSSSRHFCRLFYCLLSNRCTQSFYYRTLAVLLQCGPFQFFSIQLPYCWAMCMLLCWHSGNQKWPVQFIPVCL